MNKKKTVYLKIDEDELVAMAKDIVNPSILVMQLLRDHQLDVIELEGYVSSHTDHAKSVTGEDVRIHGRCILLDDIFEIGERLEGFVLKLKKPEVKDEKG